MISILNSSMERLANIKDSYNPWRFEEINGENTLSFNSILTEKVASYVNEKNIVELDDDYFDIAYYSKDMNEDGTVTMSVECEHISYRLNDPMYNMDYFTEIGTPNYILTRILQGTGFTVGTVEFTGNITYSAQEKKSRRRLLMEFVALLGGEVDFEKFTVSILKRRGNTDLQIFTKGKNIKIISKVYNGREDAPIIAYTCTPIALPNKEIGLGDDILLIQPELGIEDTLRVVRYGFDPDDNMLAEIEVANYINGLEDKLYRIETKKVTADKLYYGARIGPQFGFESIRSDNMARAYFNADAFKMQSGDGTGENWIDKIYFDPISGEYIFDGALLVHHLETLLAHVYKDDNGGKFKIYDNDGKLNLAMGVEGVGGDNIGGSFVIYSDAPDENNSNYRRVELGISRSYDAGLMNVRDGEGRARAGIYGDNNGMGGVILIVDSSGQVVTYLTETRGVINNERIATEDWVMDYVDDVIGGHILDKNVENKDDKVVFTDKIEKPEVVEDGK